MLNASIVDTKDKIHGLSREQEWLDISIISLDYAELINESRQEIVKGKVKSSMKDSLILYAFYFGLVLFVVCAITGGVQIFNALIGLF